MKHYIILSIIALASIILPSSCTQNNGNIGVWFGHWKLKAVIVDGVVDNSYAGNIFFSFQGKVFCQTTVQDGSAERRFADWENHDDKDFIITFPYVTDDSGNPVYDENGKLQYLYEPYPVTRMSMGENHVNVDYIKGNNLQLSLTDNTGVSVVYSLEKW